MTTPAPAARSRKRAAEESPAGLHTPAAPAAAAAADDGDEDDTSDAVWFAELASGFVSDDSACVRGMALLGCTLTLTLNSKPVFIWQLAVLWE